MLKQLMLLLGLGVVISSTHAAMDLASALNSGKVCERIDGYIQATPGNEGEVAGLVNDVNAKREGVYSQIAAQRGITSAAAAVEMASLEKAGKPHVFCK